MGPPRPPMTRSLALPLLWALLLIFATTSGRAQLNNGQFFTPGLVIIDSPSQPTPFHVGSPIPIALDISGDGLLPFPVPQITDDSPPTAILNLTVFLVSKDTSTNLSVSSDGSLLAQEFSSTVKHLDYFLPDCLHSGNYNLTFYELDRINNETFFSIYEIPITIDNDSKAAKIYKTSTCSNSTKPFEISQDDNPPPVQPFVANGKEQTSLITANPPATGVYTLSNGGGEVTVDGTTSYSPGQGFTTIYTSMALPTVTVVQTVTSVAGQGQVTSIVETTTEVEQVIIIMPTDTAGGMDGDGSIVSVGEFGVPFTGSGQSQWGKSPLAALGASLAAALLGSMVIWAG